MCGKGREMRRRKERGDHPYTGNLRRLSWCLEKMNVPMWVVLNELDILSFVGYDQACRLSSSSGSNDARSF